MSIRVAAVDPIPMVTQGLAATLAEDGHQVECPEDILEWARRDGRPAILLTLLGTEDWTLLSRLLGLRPDAVVVALLPEPDVHSYSRAVSAGAIGVLPRDAQPADVRETFRAALGDQLLLPAGWALGASWLITTVIATRLPGLTLPSRSNSGPPAPDPRPENSEGRATTIITAGAITGFTAILSAVGLTILVH